MAVGTTFDGNAPRGTGTTVFVSDPTAEAERVSQALRAAGYAVVDVPLSMLVARVAVQHPRIILVDADAEGALDVVGRMRELPDADAIDVLFIARPGGAVASPEEALAREGSGLFVRPVDVPSLVKKVDTLTGGVAEAVEAADAAALRPPSEPPPSMPGTRKRSSAPPSLPPASMRAAALTSVSDARAVGAASRPAPARSSKLPSEPPTSAGSTPGRKLVGLSSPISPELQQLLSDAEHRAEGGHDSESIVPSPEDEIEAVLPAELLALLDEPIEQDEDDEDIVPARGVAPSSAARERTYDGGDIRSTGVATTGAGSSAGITPRGTPVERQPVGDLGLTPPPHTHSGTHSGSTGAGSPTTGASDPGDVSEVVEPPPAALGLDEPQHGISVPPPTAWSPAQSSDDLLAPRPSHEQSFPAVLGPTDAARSFARAIATRMSASLCFAAADAERRVVLREGDVVTASSTSEDESLLAFLGVRGDLPKETVRRLAPKFPPFGRHAGAALVARGYLRQDQMWPTLRAHAEWLLAHMMQMTAGRLTVEPEPPGRLAGEPSVFGGSTGAAVFIEVKRRFVTTVDAIERLGGLSARVTDGPDARLLEECALGAPELEAIRTASGRSLREILEGAPEGDLATVLLALSELGVVDVLRGVGGSEGEEVGASEIEVMALDAEAIREKVRARMQLVDDGDYFALLGVTRGATGYEVRRAFLELRRAFEPTRVLTTDVADLADDVRKIVSVIEEAYDILKDAARRERYRRAIEAVPEA